MKCNSARLLGGFIGIAVLAGATINLDAGCFEYVQTGTTCINAGVMEAPCPATVYVQANCNCAGPVDPGGVGMSSYTIDFLNCVYVDRVWDDFLEICVDNGGIQLAIEECHTLSGMPCSQPEDPNS